MPKPEIRPDEFMPVNLDDGGEVARVPVNAKYDRVDFYKPLGLYMLKFYTDDVGLMTVYTDEANALRVVAEAELPLVEREFIFKSEHEGYLVAQAGHLTDEEWGIEIDEAEVSRQIAEEQEEQNGV